MKRKSMGIFESLSNTQKPFLGKLIQYLPNTETINNVISCLKVEKTRIGKILPIPTQCIYARSVGGGAAN